MPRGDITAIGFLGQNLGTGKIRLDAISVESGPVMDPKGPFGMGVIDVADLDAAKKFADGDPVMKAGIGFTCDIYPMRVNMRGVQK